VVFVDGVVDGVDVGGGAIDVKVEDDDDNNIVLACWGVI
jgi:hypothetical protein